MSHLKLTQKLKLILLVFTGSIIGESAYSQDIDNVEKTSQMPVVFLTEYEASQYINNYRDKKKRKKHTHSQSIFLNKNNFCFIQDFFNSSEGSNYDGIRLHMAIYKKIKVDGQASKKQITLFMTPTKKTGEAHVSNYNAFYNFRKTNPNAGKCDPGGVEIMSINHGELCPKQCDLTTNPDQNSASSLPPTILSEIYVLDSGTAHQYKRYYKNRFCILNKFHSKSVWLHKENFMFIGAFFKDLPSNKDYDGIRVFFASYDKWMPAIPSQARQKQMTVILTPTIKKEPIFSAFGKYRGIYLNKFSEIEKIERIKNLNHGELCPKACD